MGPERHLHRGPRPGPPSALGWVEGKRLGRGMTAPPFTPEAGLGEKPAHLDQGDWGNSEFLAGNLGGRGGGETGLKVYRGLNLGF